MYVDLNVKIRKDNNWRNDPMADVSMQIDLPEGFNLIYLNQIIGGMLEAARKQYKTAVDAEQNEASEQ